MSDDLPTFNRSHSKSGYRGVRHRPEKKTKPWVAYLWADGKSNHLGFFAVAEDAARAYNNAATARFGDMAILNVIHPA